MTKRIILSEKEEMIVREYSDTFTLGTIAKRWGMKWNSVQLERWCKKNGVVFINRNYFHGEDEMVECKHCGEMKPKYKFAYEAYKRNLVCSACHTKLYEPKERINNRKARQLREKIKQVNNL